MSQNAVQQHALPKIVTGKAPPQHTSYDAVSLCPVSSVPRFSVFSNDGREPIPHARFQVTRYVQTTKWTGMQEEMNKIIHG